MFSVMKSWVSEVLVLQTEGMLVVGTFLPQPDIFGEGAGTSGREGSTTI